MKKRVFVAVLLFALVISTSGCDSKTSTKSGYRCVMCGSYNVHAGVDNASTGIQNFWCYDCRYTWATYNGMFAGGRYGGW